MAKVGRKFGGRKRRGRKAKGALAIAKKALRRTSQNRPELKALTTNFVDTDTSIANIFTNMVLLVQGLDADERIGHEIRVRGIQIRGTLFNLAAAGASRIVRMTLIQDMQQVGDVVPGVGAVFSDSGNIGSLLSYNTQSKGKRFRVLADKTFVLTQNASNEDKVVKFFKKMNSRVMYNGGATTDIQRGGIFLRVWSNSTAATSEITSDLFIRVFYTDA